ncbi:hypothetical protein TNCV_1333381 [Trichonephila clavipes]|nr:hypothetical protein TNCV_1333381 [Trichonephila clavipes]
MATGGIKIRCRGIASSSGVPALITLEGLREIKLGTLLTGEWSSVFDEILKNGKFINLNVFLTAFTTTTTSEHILDCLGDVHASPLLVLDFSMANGLMDVI